MPSTWERASVVTPERLTVIDSDTVALDSHQRFATLPESGWGALIGWLAGSDKLIGCRDDISDHTTTTTSEYGGTSSVSSRRRSPAEQSIVNEEINGYLAAADAETQPAGVRWFVLLPDGATASDLWAHANTAAADVQPHPSALVLPVRRALEDFYRR